MIDSKAWLISHALAVVLSMPAMVQAGEWQHELAPYVWGAGMSGQTGVGDVVGDVDMSFGDILEDLELAFMGVYRATKDRFSVTADVVFMGLGSTERGPGGVLKADIDMDQTALEVDGGYQVMDRLTLLAGLRYIDLQVDTRITGPSGGVNEASSGEDWVDPVIGAIYEAPLSDAWSV
ncbi:MAG TPA: TonB-dependent receptor, partial [Steroidobacteraceae bacterium]|nr:TonB-dependent receptor [Steroidobacteraceae bacterium]